MLVLTRKIGEAINIGKDIEVVVLNVSGGRVKLGLSAPREVILQRAELAFTPESAKAPREIATVTRQLVLSR